MRAMVGSTPVKFHHARPSKTRGRGRGRLETPTRDQCYPPRLHIPRVLLPAACFLLILAACSSDDAAEKGDETTGSPDQVGSVCLTPDDCYPGLDHNDLSGAVECIDRVPEGYCTHQCSDDADCCAVEGECETDLPQVCSPFESTGMMMCFLSCEDADVQAAGAEDAAAFCQDNVSPYFQCRSSGGGADNRKICVPGACGHGAACSADADCGGGGLVCIAEIDGGYCGVRDCQSSADCPVDSSCITHAGMNYCASDCVAASDCGFCRPAGTTAACSADVTFVDGGTSVCVVG